MSEKTDTDPQDGVIPAAPAREAEVQPAQPGEATLTLLLTLSEIGVIAASLQTSVHAGWIKQISHVNLANSVLRKFHEAKLHYVRENSDGA